MLNRSYRLCHTRINRNIVECKVSMGGLGNSMGTPVLIETLWNVKTNIKELIPLCRMVLIETLWNVK